MDDTHRLILHQYRQKLADDIIISDTLLAQLVEGGVFESVVENIIKAEKTESDQINKLLDLLPERGPEAFGKFVTVIGKDYPWLAEMLIKAESGQDHDDRRESRTATASETTDKQASTGLGHQRRGLYRLYRSQMSSNNTMNNAHQVILQRYREKLAQDIANTEKLLAQLELEGVLTLDMTNSIKEGTTKASGRIYKLLDLLPTRGPEAFGKFVTVIKGDYPGLAQMLIEADSGQAKEQLSCGTPEPLNTTGSPSCETVNPATNEETRRCMTGSDDDDNEEQRRLNEHQEQQARARFEKMSNGPQPGNPFGLIRTP